MSLTVGSRLGHYDVTALIGEGGMGQVYQATDTKLNRQVALKILPEAFAADPDRLARFQREAQVLASLNHPNIAQIHGIEESEDTRALVLELVEGPTLADRIAQGPIPVDEALPIAEQIAETLEAAHEQGIIHRDLKPANIKVKDDGTVKVLDFGLAKAMAGETPGAGLSQSPTLTASGTRAGVILGTAAYMSPEQARGKTLDKRTDIWSFGCVLYEMLTAQPAFPGDTLSEVIAGVIKSEPEWNALPTQVPPLLGSVLRRCLAKDPKRRIRDIGDVGLAMEGAFDTTAAVASRDPAASQRAGWRQAFPLAAVALVVGAVIGVVVWPPTRPVPAIPHVSRFSLLLPAGVSVGTPNHYRLALSPRGTDLVFAGTDQLYFRAMDQMEATPIPQTERASEPFYSPDGQWIGFWADGELKKVPIAGGAPVTLCAAAEPFGATWSDDDTILFNIFQVGIWRVPGAGGTPELILPVGSDGGGFPRPQLLPGGEWILSHEVPSQRAVIHSLSTGERRTLLEQARDPKYLPTGHLAFVREGTLLAVPFDANQRTISGGPVPLVERVSQDPSGMAMWAHSNDGTLVYVPASRTAGRLVWVDQEGGEEVLPLPARDYIYPSVSPDGRRVAVVVADQGRDLWVYDTVSAGGRQLTEDLIVRSPVWTPDGSRIIFMSFDGSTGSTIYSVPADSSGPPEPVFASGDTAFPTSVSPDGRTMAFTRLTTRLDMGTRRREIWEVAISGDDPPVPLVQGGGARRGNAEYSPDGNWLAYQSNQSGVMKVYVQPYPGPGPVLPVSIGGAAT